MILATRGWQVTMLKQSKKMAILTLSNTVLSVSTNAQILRKSILLRKKMAKRMR
jgi:hypothetical protein